MLRTNKRKRNNKRIKMKTKKIKRMKEKMKKIKERKNSKSGVTTRNKGKMIRNLNKRKVQFQSKLNKKAIHHHHIKKCDDNMHFR